MAMTDISRERTTGKWWSALLCFRKESIIEREEYNEHSKAVGRSVLLRLEAIKAFHNRRHQSFPNRPRQFRSKSERNAVDPSQHGETPPYSNRAFKNSSNKAWSIELIPVIVDPTPELLSNTNSQTHRTFLENQTPYGTTGWNDRDKKITPEEVPLREEEKVDGSVSVLGRKTSRNAQACLQHRGCWGPTTTMGLDKSYSLVASPSDANSIMAYQPSDRYHVESSPFLRMNSEMSRDLSVGGHYMCLPPAPFRDDL